MLLTRSDPASVCGPLSDGVTVMARENAFNRPRLDGGTDGSYVRNGRCIGFNTMLSGKREFCILEIRGCLVIVLGKRKRLEFMSSMEKIIRVYVVIEVEERKEFEFM